jgi:hypothetical protein
MAWKLFTQEMVDEVLRLQDADPELQARLKGLTFNFVVVGTDAPGNEDRQVEIRLKDGRFVNAKKVDIQPIPSNLRNQTFDKTEFDAKVIGDHQLFCDMINGKIDVIELIQKVIVVGDFGKFMFHLNGFVSFFQYLSTIGIEP